MGVMTLLCAGTAFDSDSDDIIAWLSHNTQNPDKKSAWFVPGPGSTQRVGTVNSATQFFDAHHLGFLNTVNRGIGKVLDQALGLTVENVAENTVAFVRKTAAPGTTINIAGWSRGSITAVLIANGLSEFPINLFLFDPVPGGPNQWVRHKTSQINANVTSCSVVLMNDEKGLVAYLFQPQEEPFKKRRSGFEVYVLPGTHGSAVRFQDDENAIFYDTTHIGAHLVCEFLMDNGTPVSGERLLTPIDLIACYGRLQLRTVFRQITGGRPGLSISDNQVNRFYYVNNHHEALFKSQFPTIAIALAPNAAGRNISNAFVNEAKMLRRVAPAMAQVIGSAADLFVILRVDGPYEEIRAVMGYEGPVPPTDACFQVRTGF